MANHKGKIAAAHLRFAVYDNFAAEFFDDAVHEFGADFFVSHFAATEDDHNLDTIAVVEQLEDFAAFNIEVIFPNFQTKSDLFELGALGFFLSAGLLLHLLILVFAPVDDFDNWRIGVRGDFH